MRIKATKYGMNSSKIILPGRFVGLYIDLPGLMTDKEEIEYLEAENKNLQYELDDLKKRLDHPGNEGQSQDKGNDDKANTSND